MADPIVVVDYDPAWPEMFRRLALPFREAMGDTALRIDHIGSTAVPGLAAKPVIDMQISVESFDPFAVIQDPLKGLGYVWQQDNPDLTKRYFRESAGNQRVHIHVRLAGSWSEQFGLLFRDYLRAHPDDAAAYAALKYQLANEYRDARPAYVEAKSPFIWTIMERANSWSQDTGWRPGPPDV